MKNFTFIFSLFPILLFAQLQVDDTWSNEINPIFQNLDKSRVTSGILLDYAMEFTDVPAYNGTLTDSTYVNVNTVGDIYKTLFMGKVVADTLNTPVYDRYAYNWARERFAASRDSSGVYVLSGLLFDYHKLNPQALSQNKITVSNDKYYDKYINGVWQDPYLTGTTVAIASPVSYSTSKDVFFKLPDHLLLSNIKSQIINIELDIDNG